MIAFAHREESIIFYVLTALTLGPTFTEVINDIDIGD